MNIKFESDNDKGSELERNVLATSESPTNELATKGILSNGASARGVPPDPIYELGNEIEDLFDEDVENIKFNADEISSFFLKNNELENEKEESANVCSNPREVNSMERNAECNKMESLFDPAINGPHVCCVAILSKRENVEIEFVHPEIFQPHEIEHLSKRRKKKKMKMITPFCVWHRYKGNWIEDVKSLITERMFLFGETNTGNVLCDFYNHKSCKNYNEYNVMYAPSGNRYYMVGLNYMQDSSYKEILAIAQVPHFDFIYARLFPAVRAALGQGRATGRAQDGANDTEQAKSEDTAQHDSQPSVKTKGDGQKKYGELITFVDSFAADHPFDEMEFNDYYVHLSKDIEDVSNIKVKNILTILKAILLEKKVVISCSKKGNGCRMILLLLSFIPDIINFGFNVKTYEDKFEEWIKLKLPLILFHEKYVLLLHINNLQLFNEHANGKNYLISTSTGSDVYYYVKNSVDVLYELDNDELIVKKENLMNVLSLTKYEYNYLKGLNSIFQSLINFSSLFFETAKQSSITKDGHTGGGPSRQHSTSANVLNNRLCATGFLEGGNATLTHQHGEVERHTPRGGEMMPNCETLPYRNSNHVGKHHDVDGRSNPPLGEGQVDHAGEKQEYIDDEDDICVLNTKSVNFQKGERKRFVQISEAEERIQSSNTKKNISMNDQSDRYISNLRSHFHFYFKNFFMSSKENYEEGKKELREQYELNYNKGFLQLWQETENYNYFIEKDFKMNKFLKIAEQNNVPFDKQKMEDYKFVDDLLIIEKGDNAERGKNGQKNFKDVLLISLKGYVYEGTFSILKNCKEGVGKFLYNLHDITFHGEWQNDQINGSGHLLYNNKFKYFGNFKNNLFSGNGLFVDNLLNQYEGEFSNGLFNGNGKLIFNRNTYIGIFKNNNLVGKGKILHKNGLIYTGEIKNFLPHGYGFLSYNNSTVFEGYFVEGKKNGNGFLTINQGSISEECFCIEGKWRNDEPVMRRNFHIVFPNRDKYVGKIYFLPSCEETNRKGRNLWSDHHAMCQQIHHQLFEAKKLIESQIGFTDQGGGQSTVNSSKNVEQKRESISNGSTANLTGISCSDNTNPIRCANRSDSVIHHSSVLTTGSSKNCLEYQHRGGKNAGSQIPKCYDETPISIEEKNNEQRSSPPSEDPNPDQAEVIKKNVLKEKLETVLKMKERKTLRKCFEMLDKHWICNVEEKLSKNKDVVEYLKKNKVILVPHREGLSITCDKKKKENYDGKFCLGMKQGYGISVYGDTNRYEGYWHRGMKHGYGLLYEGDSIYHVHFSYDKLIKKEEISPEQVSRFKPHKAAPSVKKRGNHFLINQSFFQYRTLLSSTVCQYL
ncbi:hypothetical protein C922_01254 [Plasmodium inui San Antonio 1]|uniref:AVL9/DENND6 domain-containing protein n=1 Tax=Plasmodium inui San Antonio 1 TaxID=1237626 RepID=W7A981_9APIC|nr:hypothetical protein C922_01254 [Plasmodium inui San Antonio 1]EUD68235.1 hypothetical protein C922_01254 [Plasmodium inui San Antonio 1]